MFNIKVQVNIFIIRKITIFRNRNSFVNQATRLQRNDRNSNSFSFIWYKPFCIRILALLCRIEWGWKPLSELALENSSVLRETL